MHACNTRLVPAVLLLAASLVGPLLAAEQGKPLVVPNDLEVTLFAAEPLLSSPSDIDVDARGRVWVCEVLNYRAKKDTRPEGDRILVLEDTDGDGRADKQTVFHQGRDVDSALGICVIGEGPGRKVIVSCSPDVFVFHDDDGDLVADRRETLFTKTGQPQHDHSVHAFTVGPDGRWYFNFGNTGEAVHDREGNPVRDRLGNLVEAKGKPYRDGMVFRCLPDGTDFEVLGHNFRNNYEVGVDSFGTLWQSDNDDDGNRGVRINFVMERGNYGYTDELTGDGWRVSRANLEPEVPLQHWHQNDPGVVPNLLLTGAGSPCGICVYEGSSLPERFLGALVHCDAGQHVVRAYHPRPKGAGYAATMEEIIDGTGDSWFRPSDVCVAPDGSLIVADWHDPGVGGHGMVDTEKGRLYRTAAKGVAWSVPAADFATIAGCVAALASPNPCTRATALEALTRQPEAAAGTLADAFKKSSDPRLRSRLAWAAGMLPGRSAEWVDRLAGDADEHLRVVAARMCRLAKGDVLGLAEKLLDDPSAAVRRELAVSLAGQGDERADRIWAELAARHAAGDRFELEALGVGAQAPGTASFWDGRLAAWLARIGGKWKTPAAREIVWRSRAAASAGMIGELIVDPAIGTSESLALIRALDFQDHDRVAVLIPELVSRLEGADEKRRMILPELVMQLDPAVKADATFASRIDEARGFLAGTPRYVELVRRFALVDRVEELVGIAGTTSLPDLTRGAAAALALDIGGEEAVRRGMAVGEPAADSLIMGLGCGSHAGCIKLLVSLVEQAEATPEMRSTAVRSLVQSGTGARALVALAKENKLNGTLEQVAAVAIAASPWDGTRQVAAAVLPMPKARGGNLPPIAELELRKGNPESGKAVFRGVGTCAKCHIVDGEGKGVGPNLSGIGAKLSRHAIYESVLAPSAAISHSYETYTATLADGRTLTGLLVSKSPQSVVIRGADGVDATISASEIEELVRQPVSLMPADLATAMSVDDLVDLVAWLETLRAAQ